MSTLCIVPCGKRKIWDKNPRVGPTEAKFVYTGPFAKKCIEYAEKYFPSSWCILSAKHGFLFPHDEVPANYKVTFKETKSNPITLEELKLQAKEKNLDSYEKIVVLGGREYIERIKNTFSGKEVSLPLSGCRNLMQMMKKLNKELMGGDSG